MAYLCRYMYDLLNVDKNITKPKKINFLTFLPARNSEHWCKRISLVLTINLPDDFPFKTMLSVKRRSRRIPLILKFEHPHSNIHCFPAKLFATFRVLATDDSRQ